VPAPKALPPAPRVLPPTRAEVASCTVATGYRLVEASATARAGAGPGSSAGTTTCLPLGPTGGSDAAARDWSI
jgi:hypothetical protein